MARKDQFNRWPVGRRRHPDIAGRPVDRDQPGGCVPAVGSVSVRTAEPKP